MKRNLEQLREPGAFSARPLKEHGFNLNKGEFQDALNLRYDKLLKNLPSKVALQLSFHHHTCNELSSRRFYQQSIQQHPRL